MDIESLADAIASGNALAELATRAGLSVEQGRAVLRSVIDHAAAGGRAGDMVEIVTAETSLDTARVRHFLPLVMNLLREQAAAEEAARAAAASAAAAEAAAAASGRDPSSPGAPSGIRGMVSNLFGRKG